MALKADGHVVVWGSTAYGIPNIPLQRRMWWLSQQVMAMPGAEIRRSGARMGYSFDGEILAPVDLKNVIRLAAGHFLAWHLSLKIIKSRECGF